jgi:Fe2+ transport system protein B
MANDEEVIPVTQQSAETAVAPAPIPVEAQNQKSHKKKIIKDGRISLKVTELEKSKSQVDNLVKENNGYYANESLNNTDYESTYNLTIRVPATNFERLITKIESGDGEITYKQIDARDVTEQFIDLETRLANKRKYLKRYSDLLNNANSIDEILEIEEKIRGLEEEIESTTGRLKYLSDLVNYSTLNLTITKQKAFKYNPVNKGKFTERLKQSLSKGWVSFISFLLFMIKLWPFWIIIYLISFSWRKFRRKKKNK